MRPAAAWTTIFLLLLTALVSPLAAQRRQPPRQPVPTIEGKLIKKDLKPVQYTELELVPLDMEQVPNDSRYVGVSDTYGRFRFVDVPPGRYTLSINFGEKPTFLSPFSTFFYPGTSNRDEATVFTVDGSTRVRDLVFKLQTELTKNPIVGRITWPDGKPVQGAIIACRDVEFDVRNTFGSVRSDKNGMFTLEAFVGRRYQLGIMLSDRDMLTPYDPANLIAIAESDEFVLAKTQGILQIKLINSRDSQRLLEKYVG